MKLFCFHSVYMILFYSLWNKKFSKPVATAYWHACSYLQIGSLSKCTSWPQAGGFPSLSGTLAVALAQQIKLWKALGSPLMGLLLYLFVMALVIVLGTFPRINNFSNLAAFLQGLILAPIILNFCMRTKTKRLKRSLVFLRVFYFIFLLLLVIISIAFFYEVQKVDASQAFCYIDCVPFVSGLCDTYELTT